MYTTFRYPVSYEMFGRNRPVLSPVQHNSRPKPARTSHFNRFNFFTHKIHDLFHLFSESFLDWSEWMWPNSLLFPCLAFYSLASEFLTFTTQILLTSQVFILQQVIWKKMASKHNFGNGRITRCGTTQKLRFFYSSLQKLYISLSKFHWSDQIWSRNTNRFRMEFEKFWKCQNFNFGLRKILVNTDTILLLLPAVSVVTHYP